MNKKFIIAVVIAFVVLPLAFLGCKAKIEKEQTPETQAAMPESTPQTTGETLSMTEPAQTVATETIPPSAAPQIAQTPAQVTQTLVQEKESRNKDIQKALKNAGLYAGAIDGKLGPRTKKAIEEFQRSNGLKVDGKVGPKTWAELEKYLVETQQVPQ